MNVNSGGIQALGQYQHLQSQIQENKSILENRGKALEGETTDQRLKDACEDFQAILVKQMLDSMRKTVNKQGLLSGGQAEKIFEDMLYDKYAKKMSSTSGFGLDDMLYKQLSQQKPQLDQLK